MPEPSYLIRYTPVPPELRGAWEGNIWHQAETMQIANFRPESSDHHPGVQARFLYDSAHVYGIYRVFDRYVTCTRSRFQSDTFRDSCVEFFIQPQGALGYFNFEFNCGGTLAVFYITDCTRTPTGFQQYTHLTPEEGALVRVYHSLPQRIQPEISTPCLWVLEFAIPLTLLEKYTGSLGTLAGQRWRGNAFKCAEESSHPHWAAWNAVDEFNFHLPRCFGELVFTAGQG